MARSLGLIFAGTTVGQHLSSSIGISRAAHGRHVFVCECACACVCMCVVSRACCGNVIKGIGVICRPISAEVGKKVILKNLESKSEPACCFSLRINFFFCRWDENKIIGQRGGRPFHVFRVAIYSSRRPVRYHLLSPSLDKTCGVMRHRGQWRGVSSGGFGGHTAGPGGSLWTDTVG